MDKSWVKTPCPLLSYALRSVITLINTFLFKLTFHRGLLLTSFCQGHLRNLSLALMLISALYLKRLYWHLGPQICFIYAVNKCIRLVSVVTAWNAIHKFEQGIRKWLSRNNIWKPLWSSFRSTVKTDLTPQTRSYERLYIEIMRTNLQSLQTVAVVYQRLPLFCKIHDCVYLIFVRFLHFYFCFMLAFYLWRALYGTSNDITISWSFSMK